MGVEGLAQGCKQALKKAFDPPPPDFSQGAADKRLTLHRTPSFDLNSVCVSLKGEQDGIWEKKD